MKYHSHIQAILDQTGLTDPREAIRKKARELLHGLSPLFPDPPPHDMKQLASCIGLHWSDEHPSFSHDSEIAPQADGRVVLRVNQSRPITRQRFSVAHEIGHTLFPDYQLSVRCRKANDRKWNDDDLIETLCDVAASEIMFPLYWFEQSISSMQLTGDNVAQLADHYIASRESTVRRLVELHPEPMAAVFFSWKLKPEEKKAIRRNATQQFMFEDLKPEVPELKMRVDYPICNDSFRAVTQVHIPEHKSIASDGPIYEASISQRPCDGRATLSFGRNDTEFDIIALPIYTDDKATGPANASSVVAILRPVS